MKLKSLIKAKKSSKNTQTLSGDFNEAKIIN